MSNENNLKTFSNFKYEKLIALFVHLLTGLGVLAGFFALISVINNNQSNAFLWLGLAFLIDSIDGTLARKFNVKKNFPNIDGKMLDSIIDFFNYVIVPAITIYWFKLVPDNLLIFIPSILILVSIYSYVNLNIMTSDHYYNGFPAIWNVVVLYFYIFGTSQTTNLVILIFLLILKFSPLKCIHPLRVKKLKNISIFFTIVWFTMSALLIISMQTKIKPIYELFFMFAWVSSNLYFIFISLYKSLIDKNY